jgi:hypothetical protein
VYGVHARDRYEDEMIGVPGTGAVEGKSATMCCRILAGPCNVDRVNMLREKR